MKTAQKTRFAPAMASPIDPQLPLPLLGGLTPAQFMRRHWQKKPLLVRQALPQFQALLPLKALQAFARDENVQSRLLTQTRRSARSRPQWQLQHGPLAQWPQATGNSSYSVLLQSMDTHSDAVCALREQFRFIPDARLDDIMISYASQGGGVGPHFDSYDVFLLQAAGKRRWQIGQQEDLRLVDGLPLKILRQFTPTQEYVLEPGDMLYLPPSYAHDGVALEEGCQTYSIGFYAPQRAALAAQLLHRVADCAQDAISAGDMDAADNPLYADPTQAATATPALLPAQLVRFAQQGLKNLLQDPLLLQEMLGEYLTDKPAPPPGKKPAAHWQSLHLARTANILYDTHAIYCQGQTWHASGKDAQLLQQLANTRSISRAQHDRASKAAQALLADWLSAGVLLAR